MSCVSAKTRCIQTQGGCIECVVHDLSCEPHEIGVQEASVIVAGEGLHSTTRGTLIDFKSPDLTPEGQTCYRYARAEHTSQQLALEISQVYAELSRDLQNQFISLIASIGRQAE